MFMYPKSPLLAIITRRCVNSRPLQTSRVKVTTEALDMKKYLLILRLILQKADILP